MRIKHACTKRPGNEFLIGQSMPQQAEYWRRKQAEDPSLAAAVRAAKEKREAEAAMKKGDQQ